MFRGAKCFVSVLTVFGAVTCLHAAETGAIERPSVDQTLLDAENGDIQAQLTMGAMYERRGSFTNAFRWYSRSAEKGSPEGQFKMGVFYGAGLGVLRDYTQAVQWFRVSADQGFAPAQYNVGVALEKGLGIQLDYREALKWYVQAANGGDSLAQAAAGRLLEKGLGGPPDLVEAHKWYSLAAMRGLTNAVTSRDNLAKRLSAQQLKEAQTRYTQFVSRTGRAEIKATSAPKVEARPKPKSKDFLD